MNYDEQLMDSVDLKYPHYLIKDLGVLKAHQALVLQQMMKPVKGKRSDYRVYTENNGELYEIGSIFRSSVKPMIDLVGVDNLELHYSKSKTYIGDMLYILG